MNLKKKEKEETQKSRIVRFIFLNLRCYYGVLIFGFGAAERKMQNST